MKKDEEEEKEEEEEETIVDLYGIHVTQISTNSRAWKGRKYFSGRRKDVACATDGEDSCSFEDAITVCTSLLPQAVQQNSAKKKSCVVGKIDEIGSPVPRNLMRQGEKLQRVKIE